MPKCCRGSRPSIRPTTSTACSRPAVLCWRERSVGRVAAARPLSRMDVTASLEAPCPAAVLFELVDDLSTYPQWNGLVHSAVAEPGDEPAWDVELRARLGPLTRSKRLRMVRTLRDAEAFAVTFERDQADGRNHSPWVLGGNHRRTRWARAR